MSEDVPDCKVLKPLLSGSIPVEQFVQTLEKVSSRHGHHAPFLRANLGEGHGAEDGPSAICHRLPEWSSVTQSQAGEMGVRWSLPLPCLPTLQPTDHISQKGDCYLQLARFHWCELPVVHTDLITYWSFHQQC